MDAIVCPSCRLSIVPIFILEQAKRSKQWWRITKCPRERCGFNIDLTECDKPKPRSAKKPETDDGHSSFWRYEF